jgi:hypothetical protein
VADLTFLIAGGKVNGTLPGNIIQWFDAALVVREAALRDVGSRSITLEVDDRNNRSIDRQLLIVGTKTMAVSIRVREKTGLEDWVGRRFNVRNEMGRRKSSLLWKNQICLLTDKKGAYLLNLSEVVLWVFIENKLPDRAERIIPVGPDFCKIKNVVTEFLSLLRRHGLLTIDEIFVSCRHSFIWM